MRFISIDDIDDVQLLGELLRHTTFAPPDHGCRGTFDLRPGWNPIDPASSAGGDLLRLLLDRDTVTEARAWFDEEGYLPSMFRREDGLECAWHWNGDGTLLFRLDSRTALRTTDCKKDNRWSLFPAEPGFMGRPSRNLAPHARLQAANDPTYGAFNLVAMNCVDLDLHLAENDLHDRLAQLAVRGNRAGLLALVEELRQNAAHRARNRQPTRVDHATIAQRLAGLADDLRLLSSSSDPEPRSLA